MKADPNSNGFPQTPAAAARVFLASGFAPLPVPPHTKSPVLVDWPKFRVTPGAVDAHFVVGSNIGVLTGEPSGGLVDVDLDCPEAIAAAPLLLPPTGMISGRESAPRSHWWFQVDSPPAKASTKFLHPYSSDPAKRLLLELRSTGGQTIVPPSIYPADDEHPLPEACVWHSCDEPARVDLDELWAAVNTVAAASLLARYWNSGRHSKALALSGGLLRAGWTVLGIQKLITAICAAAGDRELDDRLRTVRDTDAKLRQNAKVEGWPTLARELGASGEAIVSTVRGWLGCNVRLDPKQSVAEKSNKVVPQYKPVAEYVPFPTDCLPAPWAEFVHQAAEALRVDEGMVALPLLSVLAGAIGNTRRVYLGGEWFEPAVIWTCVVAESGGRKSSAADASVDFVKARQKRRVKEYKDELLAHRAAQADHKAKARNEQGEPPTPPLLKRVLASDITIEKLSGLLDDNRRGMLVYRDELAGWLGSFTKYKSTRGGTDEPNWLSIHRADAIIYDRKTGDKTSVFVPHAAVSITGGIQPGVLSKLASAELFDSGLVARIIFAMPPRTPKTWSDAQIDHEVKAAASASLDALYSLESDLDEDGEQRPKVVKMSHRATARLKQFVNEWGLKQFEAEGERAAALAKLEALPGRFALIRHCILHPEEDLPIALECLEAGIRLAEWCARETDRVYAILSESLENKETRRLVEAVRRLEKRNAAGVSARELSRSNPSRWPFAETAEVAIDSLVGLGLGEWIDIPPKSDGGRPTRRFKFTATDKTDETFREDPEDDDDAGGSPPDETPEKPLPDPAADSEKRESSEGSVSFVSVNGESGRDSADDETTSPVMNSTGGFCQPAAEVPSVPRQQFTLVDSPDLLGWTIAAVEDAGGPVGIDTETTGLDPRQHRVRLLQLATHRDTIVIDLQKIPRETLLPLFDVLSEMELVGHHLSFDLSFLERLGFVPGRVRDTMLSSQVLLAGDVSARHGLKDVANRALDMLLDKELQSADWSGPLSPDMLRYAAADAEIPVRVWSKHQAEASNTGLGDVLAIEMNALPCVAWASSHGIGFDRSAWESLATAAEAQRGQLRVQLDALAPDSAGLFGSRNWDSPEQVKDAFASIGIPLESTDDDALAALAHPLAAAVRDYRSIARLATTYGRDWLRHVADDGRVYATWKQIGAGASGRMSCKEPNLQQLPRDVRYRRCFIASPGNVLVKADYSQIELRIAAKLTGDRRMLDAYRKGEDLHTLTAQALLGKTDVTKSDRQLAKAINFGLLYGMGAKNLTVYALSNYGVGMTFDEATRHRETFFRTYPGLRKWHRTADDAPVDTRTLAGRRRLGVTRFSEKLNTPVQGTGADGLKLAMGLLWKQRADCPEAFPVLFVHDEIVIECPESTAEQAKNWLTRCMVSAMAPLIDPVAVEVEASIGRTWGG